MVLPKNPREHSSVTRKRAQASARKPARKAGRPKGATSPRAAAASRENGAKGGRDRDRLPDAVRAELGSAPITAKELRRWCVRLLAKLLELTFSGEIGGDLADRIRAQVKTTLAALPANDRGGSDGEDDDEDEDDDEARGPELTPSEGGAPIRVG